VERYSPLNAAAVHIGKEIGLRTSCPRNRWSQHGCKRIERQRVRQDLGKIPTSAFMSGGAYQAQPFLEQHQFIKGTSYLRRRSLQSDVHRIQNGQQLTIHIGNWKMAHAAPLANTPWLVGTPGAPDRSQTLSQ
jgi:hypothetical protein